MSFYEETLENSIGDFILPPEVQIANMVEQNFEEEVCPIVIAVGGPGGIGKSTFSSKLALELGEAIVLELDAYKTCRLKRKEKGLFGAHPEANEMDLVSEHLAMLKSDLTIDKPIYCSEAGRSNSTERFTPRRYNIVEGEIATYPQFKDLIDFHIYIDADLTTQLKTRLTRDITHKGYSRDKAFATFFGSNLIEFSEFGLPTKEWADVVLFCDEQYSLSIKDLYLQ